MKRYEKITDLIPQLESGEPVGQWVVDTSHAGTKEDPAPFPYVTYNPVVWELNEAVRDCLAGFGSETDAYDYDEAKKILRDMESVFSGERFCEGNILDSCKDGQMLKWMRRLKVLDGVPVGRKLIVNDEQAIKDDPDAEYYRFDFGESYVKVKRIEGEKHYYVLTVEHEWNEYSKVGSWFFADDRIYEKI